MQAKWIKLDLVSYLDTHQNDDRSHQLPQYQQNPHKSSREFLINHVLQVVNEISGACKFKTIGCFVLGACGNVSIVKADKFNYL